MASSGNFCTINPLGAQGGGTVATGTLSNGNTSAVIDECCLGTVGVTSGKWYWEWALTGSSTSGMAVGWANQQVYSDTELGYNSPASATGAQIVYMYLSKNPPEIISDAPKSASNGTDTSMSEISQNDIIGLAADFDNDKWYFSINGSFTDVRSGQDPATGSNPLCSASSGGGLVTIARTAGFTWFPAMGNWAASTRDIKVNFGQDSTFSGSFSAGGNSDGNGFGDFKYSVPTGFLAMCSANVPVSDDIDPAQTDDDYAGGKLFNVLTYTASGGDSYTGLGFKPDLVWVKWRGGSQSHGLFDSSRGTSKVLNSDSTNAEATSSGLTSFDTDGFTMGEYYNQSGRDYVAWCWKVNGGTTSSNTSGDINSTVQVNDKAGMSIVQYTGNGSQNQTIGHGLTKAPEMVWMKNLSNSNVGGIDMDWIVALSTSTGSPFASLSGSAQTLELNDSKSLSGKYRTEGNFTPTTSTFNVPNNGNAPYWFNANANNYIAYCWHSVEGFSKFGFYEGNGNTDGTFVYTGFRPRMVFLKQTDSAAEWACYDTARDTFNMAERCLEWDLGVAEKNSSNLSTDGLDFLSNGFKFRGGGGGRTNQSGKLYLYGAWGDVPFKYNNTF